MLSLCSLERIATSLVGCVVVYYCTVTFRPVTHCNVCFCVATSMCSVLSLRKAAGQVKSKEKDSLAEVLMVGVATCCEIKPHFERAVREDLQRTVHISAFFTKHIYRPLLCGSGLCSVDCPLVSVRQSEVFKWQRYLRPSPSLLGAINAKSPCGLLFFRDRRQLGVLQTHVSLTASC